MSNNATKKYSLRVFDDEYTILTDEPEEHVMRVAQHVDSIMNDIAQKSDGAHPKKVAVLAALKIASTMFNVESDLNKQNKQQEQLVGVIDEQTTDLL